MKDLIRNLLMKEPTQRLGYVGGFREILQHSFFQGMDFAALENMTLPPPFNTVGGSFAINPNFQANIQTDEQAMQETILTPVELDKIDQFQDRFAAFDHVKRKKRT